MAFLVLAKAVLCADLPVVQRHPIARSVLAGDRLELRASSDPLVPTSISWWRDGQRIPGAGLPLLVIEHAGPSHQGHYRARFENAGGVSWTREAFVRVVYRPPAPGVQDIAFTPGIGGSDVRSIIVQADGKIVVGGDFQFGGRSHLVRLLPDGSLDPSFDPGGVGPNGRVRAMVSVAGGVLVGGDFTSYRGVPCRSIALLDNNGVPVVGFRSDLGFDNDLLALAVDSAGRILAAGKFQFVRSAAGSLPRRYLTRLHPDGTPDLDFAAETVDGTVHDIAIDSEGRVVVVGAFGGAGGEVLTNIARFLNDGSRDLSFFAGEGGLARVVALGTGGRIYLGGGFNTIQGMARSRLARLHDDGRLDLTFAYSCNDAVHALEVDAAGRLLVGGQFTEIGGSAYRRLVRLLPFEQGAQIDVGFEALAIDDKVRAIAFDDTGELIVGGEFDRPGQRVLRLLGSAGDESVPVFLSTPSHGGVVVGQRVQLGAIGGGGPSLQYQWLRDGELLPYECSEVLSIEAVSEADAGSYSVRISNSTGVATSVSVPVRPRARLPVGGRSHFVEGAALAITPGAVVQSSLQMPGDFDLVDVRVEVDLRHPQTSDLRVSLMGPDETEVELVAADGESSGRFLLTAFEDRANREFEDAEPPYAGTFRPSQALADFVGKGSLGEWRLKVSDSRGGGVAGEVLSWGIEFRGAPVAAEMGAFADAFGLGADPMADSDGDGEPDVLHFAFGVAPDERVPGPTQGFAPGEYRFAHWRWTLPGGIDYRYESWNSAAGRWDELIVGEGDREGFPSGLELRSLRLPDDVDDRLLRVRVTLLP